MFDFELPESVITLHILLTERWYDLPKINKINNVNGMVNLIDWVMKIVPCYVNLHDISFYYNDHDRVPLYFTDKLLKDSTILINSFSLRIDKSLYRNSTNVISFFNDPTYNKSDPRFPSSYSYMITVGLLSLDSIDTPYETTINLHCLYFKYKDVESFELKNDITIKNIDKQLKQNKEHTQENKYQYSKILKPYNDIISAFSSYIDNEGNKSDIQKIDVKNWLNVNYKDKMQNNKFTDVFTDLIFLEYDLVTKTGVNANKKQKK